MTGGPLHPAGYDLYLRSHGDGLVATVRDIVGADALC
jgi:hypothetical protein